MSQQTSIHIRPVKWESELHNERRKVLDYIRPELSINNEVWKSPDFPCIDEQTRLIKLDYANYHAKKMHAKATPIREAVVVITEDTTMQQLLNACAKCQEKFGIAAMQVYTHKDEGHTDKNDVWKPNLHAHIVFNWYNADTHTTCKLSRQDMAEMQTMFADCLAMERGKSSDRKHLTAIQMKNKAEAAKLKALQQEVADLQTQLISDLTNVGNDMVTQFDRLADCEAPTQKEKESRDLLAAECERQVRALQLRDHEHNLRIYIERTAAAIHALTARIINQAAAAKRSLAAAARKNRALRFFVPSAALVEVATIDEMQARIDKATADRDDAKRWQDAAQTHEQQANRARESAEYALMKAKQALSTANEDGARPWKAKCEALQEQVDAIPDRIAEARLEGIKIGKDNLAPELERYKHKIADISTQLQNSRNYSTTLERKLQALQVKGKGIGR